MDHVIEAAAPAKYKHIDFKPPEGVRKAAKRGLEMRKEHGRGGTAVGVARARDLMNGKTISPSTARRMKAYFDRHQPDQKAEGFDSGEDGYPSAGRVAWLLWGSDAGYAWAKKLVKQMNAADEKVSGSADETVEKTKLNVQAMAQAHWGSESFRKWFGNSKVADKNGKPLVKQMNAADEKVSAAYQPSLAGLSPTPAWDTDTKGEHDAALFFKGKPYTADVVPINRLFHMGLDRKNAICGKHISGCAAHIDRIKKAIQSGAVLPPVSAELSGGLLLVLDGNHRVAAAKQLGHKYVPVVVKIKDKSEEVLASFKLRTPTGIPGLRDDDDHDSGYGDFTAALFGALSREKVMDLVEMVGVRMLRALAGPALNGSLKRLLPSLTDSFNIGRKVPITEQEVLSLALRQAKDAAKMDLSARHKALLSEVKSVLESELRGKELPPGDSSMKVPEATDTVDEMYEHHSRRSVKASPCGCDSGCACSTPQNSSGQPPSDMTISNLKQIVRDAQELLGLLHENMELMGWAEDKITQAKVAVDSVKNYVLTDFGHEASEAVVLTVAAAKKPWEEKREPEGKLSKRWREEAEKRAKKAGRKYPNQVDNMWAKQQQNEARASVAAALLSAADVLSRGGER